MCTLVRILEWYMTVKQGRVIQIVCFCFFFCCFLKDGYAQQHVDFSGVVSKYDSTFAGIGPVVYFLPPPKTEEELLDDRYAEKEIDSAVVEEYVNRMKYYHRLNLTGDGRVLAKYMPVAEAQQSSIEGKLLMQIGGMGIPNQPGLQADVENRLAMEYVAVGACDFAVEFFEKAMEDKQALGNQSDWEAIAHNLAVTYEYLGQLDKARALRQELYNRSVKNGSQTEQAEALMELALVKAKMGASSEAEQDIIRKVVPLFRRARNESGRASAYRMLADIYFLQQKYPEAQWFLVQAKTIVDKEGITDQLPEIIFNLAETKKHSGNPQVAIEEYKMADDLAKKDHIMGMQLAIQDALGSLYHEAGDYDGAALALNRYDRLKNMLFKGEKSLDN